MNKINGYANYGVLTHEKQVIFTVANKHPHADVSEAVEMVIPDGWDVAENDMGTILIISPDGITYTADEIISSFGDKPVLEWYDGENSHRISLEWSPL